MRKASGLQSGKKQLLMSVVKPPDPSETTVAHARKIKNIRGSPLKLLLENDQTSPSARDRLNETFHETPKFFSNPPIYNRADQPTSFGKKSNLRRTNYHSTNNSSAEY